MALSQKKFSVPDDFSKMAGPICIKINRAGNYKVINIYIKFQKHTPNLYSDIVDQTVKNIPKHRSLISKSFTRVNPFKPEMTKIFLIFIYNLGITHQRRHWIFLTCIFSFFWLILSSDSRSKSVQRLNQNTPFSSRKKFVSKRPVSDVI